VNVTENGGNDPRERDAHLVQRNDTMKSFLIQDRRVGEGAPVFIVAELSANHVGRKDVALATIEAAAKAGADAIKLQTYTPDTLTLKSDVPPFVVQTANVWSGRTLHDLYAEAMTPWEWHAELKAAVEAHGLVCFSTPFDATAIEFLETLDVPAHKIASFELNDLPLVERAARTGKPLIMSTGMASLGDIEAALAVCRDAGNTQIALLRCVSSYPAKPESMGLASFELLSTLGVVVGLSDHTRDSTVAIASVALGAKVIEKHFILDRKNGGPDAFFSLEPAEFKAMVDAVRETEKALGTPRFGPAPEEVASVAFRRSLFVAQDVEAGQVLTCDDIRSVRPSNGISPRHLPAVLGRTAARALRKATPLTWDMVGQAPALRVALRESTEVTLPPDVKAPYRASWVAEEGGKVVGTVAIERARDRAWTLGFTPAEGVLTSSLDAQIVGDVLRAAEVTARALGAIYLVAKLNPDDVVFTAALKRAGYYGFAKCKDGLLKCERRLTEY